MISLAKMTMRSDVWHLCITQDEFGVRVSALATKIKDSGQIGERERRKRDREPYMCVRVCVCECTWSKREKLVYDL